MLDPVRDWILEQYDASHPVIVTQSSVVSREPGRVIVDVSGFRYRECRYIPPPSGEGSAPGEPLRDLRINRLDKPATGASRRPGPIPAQRWEVLDIDGITSVTIWANYSCNGRYVSNKFVSVEL